MDRITIKGGKRLEGRLVISGAKNAALTLLPCALLTDEPLTLRNLPRLADVDSFGHLLNQLGVSTMIEGSKPDEFGRVMTLRASTISSTVAPYDIVRKMRASVLVLGPLVARAGEATVSLPGGCAIGMRPVDLHLKALEALGAELEIAAGYVKARAPDGGLKGGTIRFPFVSVGATDFRSRLADFSSRGDFASELFRPTLVAPGVKVVSLRSSGLSVTGIEGIGFNGDTGIAPGYVPYYTTASGTSFSAPQVAGAIALMLEANPRLTPAEVRDILQRTATPLASYYAHEVGAGMLNTHAAVLEAAFPARKLGNFRATLNRGQVRFMNDPLQEISGTVAPGASGYETTVQMPAGALMASMQIGWSTLSTNDLGFAMYDASGAKQADRNEINLPGLTGNRERAVLQAPPAGAWRLTVKNTLGALAPTSQRFAGVLEVARAEYAPLRDIDGLSESQRAVVYQNIRSFVMSPAGNKFRPAQGVTRGELAESLVLGARVPQYVPAAASYRDVRNSSLMLFVESVQHAPQGALFTDVERGGAFSPNDTVGRLTAAIALVRAAGLQSEAEAAQTLPLTTILDAGMIPAALRGYVRVTISRGLLSTSNAYFRPQAPLTRLELAQAMVAMQKLQTQ